MGAFLELLKRKYGPAPLWVYLAIGVVGLAWYLRSRKKAVPSSEEAPADNGGVLGEYALAYPMPYTGDQQISVPGNPVRDPFDVPSFSPDPNTPHTTGPLKEGTTLADLAELYWGHREWANRIYNQNRTLIEDAARKAGYANSQNGQILIPGINLEVPPTDVR